MLTLEDYLTSNGKYPWRARHVECTEEVKKNAAVYLEKLNSLLKELFVKNPKFSSGFRPSEVNKKTPGASKTSTHMFGMGGDLEDHDGSLDSLLLLHSNKGGLLEKHGLYLETPKTTIGWAHTQTRAPASGSRVFNP